MVSGAYVQLACIAYGKGMVMKYVRINGGKVAKLIDEQGLKRWWVAEMIGIHKTTLKRWVSGRIRKVRTENCDKLCAMLATQRASIVCHLTHLEA